MSDRERPPFLFLTNLRAQASNKLPHFLYPLSAVDFYHVPVLPYSEISQHPSWQILLLMGAYFSWLGGNFPEGLKIAETALTGPDGRLSRATFEARKSGIIPKACTALANRVLNPQSPALLDPDRKRTPDFFFELLGQPPNYEIREKLVEIFFAITAGLGVGGSFLLELASQGTWSEYIKNPEKVLEVTVLGAGAGFVAALVLSRKLPPSLLCGALGGALGYFTGQKIAPVLEVTRNPLEEFWGLSILLSAISGAVSWLAIHQFLSRPHPAADFIKQAKERGLSSFLNLVVSDLYFWQQVNLLLFLNSTTWGNNTKLLFNNMRPPRWIQATYPSLEVPTREITQSFVHFLSRIIQIDTYALASQRGKQQATNSNLIQLLPPPFELFRLIFSDQTAVRELGRNLWSQFLSLESKDPLTALLMACPTLPLIMLSSWLKDPKAEKAINPHPEKPFTAMTGPTAALIRKWAQTVNHLPTEKLQQELDRLFNLYRTKLIDTDVNCCLLPPYMRLDRLLLMIEVTGGLAETQGFLNHFTGAAIKAGEKNPLLPLLAVADLIATIEILKTNFNLLNVCLPKEIPERLQRILSLTAEQITLQILDRWTSPGNLPGVLTMQHSKENQAQLNFSDVFAMLIEIGLSHPPILKIIKDSLSLVVEYFAERQRNNQTQEGNPYNHPEFIKALSYAKSLHTQSEYLEVIYQKLEEIATSMAMENMALFQNNSPLSYNPNMAKFIQEQIITILPILSLERLTQLVERLVNLAESHNQLITSQVQTYHSHLLNLSREGGITSPVINLARANNLIIILDATIRFLEQQQLNPQLLNTLKSVFTKLKDTLNNLPAISLQSIVNYQQ